MYVLSDTQSAFSLFYSRFIKLFDKHFPRKKIKPQYNTRKPWLMPALKQSIHIKNKLYRKLITSGSSYYECQYKMDRNKLNSLLKCAEKQYIADLLESNKSNFKGAHRDISTTSHSAQFHTQVKLQHRRFTLVNYKGLHLLQACKNSSQNSLLIKTKT